mmetsp:Transcript_52303/g.114831  ORF Transcript_52303/g.114831 Transcript_52303/m.114831 type:complete len:345 (+) Transcript_52303:500-1534(+)
MLQHVQNLLAGGLARIGVLPRVRLLGQILQQSPFTRLQERLVDGAGLAIKILQDRHSIRNGLLSLLSILHVLQVVLVVGLAVQAKLLHASLDTLNVVSSFPNLRVQLPNLSGHAINVDGQFVLPTHKLLLLGRVLGDLVVTPMLVLSLSLLLLLQPEDHFLNHLIHLVEGPLRFVSVRSLVGLQRFHRTDHRRQVTGLIGRLHVLQQGNRGLQGPGSVVTRHCLELGEGLLRLSLLGGPHAGGLLENGNSGVHSLHFVGTGGSALAPLLSPAITSLLSLIQGVLGSAQVTTGGADGCLGSSQIRLRGGLSCRLLALRRVGCGDSLALRLGCEIIAVLRVDLTLL